MEYNNKSFKKKDVNNRLQRIEDLLKQHISLSKEIYNMEEACLFLGITKNHLYKLTSGGQISHSKPGGKKLFFMKQDLHKWAMSNQVCTQAEIDQGAMRQIMKSKFSIN